MTEPRPPLPPDRIDELLEATATTVIAVHMDAINHCVDTRAVLHAEIARAGVGNVLVPADGERVALYQT